MGAGLVRAELEINERQPKARGNNICSRTYGTHHLSKILRHDSSTIRTVVMLAAEPRRIRVLSPPLAE